MEFGLSKVCITPDFTTCLACSQQKDTHYEKVNDDIYVRCLVLSYKNEKIIILSYDLLFHSRDLHKYIFKYANKRYGLKKQNILLNFTHNHNSPSTLGYNDFSSSPKYEKLLIKATESAIDKAFSSMQPGSMGYGEIPGHWAVNRRKPTPEGISLAPNPDGLVDDRIYLLRLISESGKTEGLIINYACHPVHYPDTLALTSEYPGYLCKYIEEKIPGCTPLFIQGAGANSRPASTADGESFVHRFFDYIEKMSAEMGNAIVSYLDTDSMKLMSPEFSVVTFDVEIPFDDEGLQYFKACMNDTSLSNHLRRNAKSMVSTYNSLKDSFTLTCGIMKLSNSLYIVHMGGEPCCEVKFNLLKIFKDSNVIFAGYTDPCAYIITDHMIPEDGYEVRCFLEYMHKGRIKPGIDRRIYDAYETAFKKL